MLVTMGMNGALVGPSSHFDLSVAFDVADLENAKFIVYLYL